MNITVASYRCRPCHAQQLHDTARIRGNNIMYQSNRSVNIYISHVGIPQAFEAFSCPEGREFDELSLPRSGAFDHHS